MLTLLRLKSSSPDIGLGGAVRRRATLPRSGRSGAAASGGVPGPGVMPSRSGFVLAPFSRPAPPVAWSGRGAGAWSVGWSWGNPSLGPLPPRPRSNAGLRLWVRFGVRAGGLGVGLCPGASRGPLRFPRGAGAGFLEKIGVLRAGCSGSHRSAWN